MKTASYRKRWLTGLISDSIKTFKVVVLTGARQTGKTTLLREESLFNVWHYISLDDFELLARAQKDPSNLWFGRKRVIIDEAQKSTRLLSAIKHAVDSDPKQRFVLSGSANLLLMKRISESLAGRAVYFVLYPMSLGEIHKKAADNPLIPLFAGKSPKASVKSNTDIIDCLLKGLMPPLLAIKGRKPVLEWWEGYIATYLERDLRDLSQIDSLPDFRRLMGVLAARTGNILNRADAARDAGLSRPTATRYINLLEVSHIIELVSGYFKNRTKRVVKAPKIYWLDPALAVFLMGIYDAKALKQARELGALFEGLVYHHLRIWNNLLTPRGRIYYWRTENGTEVDFILEYGRKLLALEIKKSDKISYADTANLRAFIEQHPQTEQGIVIYTGKEVKRITEKITAIPWTYFT